MSTALGSMAQSPADSSAIALSSPSESLKDSLRHFVVVSTESGTPLRDVCITTDDGQQTASSWDGTFALRDTYSTLTLAHSRFEKRLMYRGEADGDTILLIPNLFAINEVVIYGHRRSQNDRLNLRISSVDLQMAQAPQQGFNPLGILALAYDAIWGKKVRHKKEIKEQKRKMILDNY